MAVTHTYNLMFLIFKMFKIPDTHMKALDTHAKWKSDAPVITPKIICGIQLKIHKLSIWKQWLIDILLTIYLVSNVYNIAGMLLITICNKMGSIYRIWKYVTKWYVTELFYQIWVGARGLMYGMLRPLRWCRDA